MNDLIEPLQTSLDKYQCLKDNHPDYLYRIRYNTFVVESLKLIYMDTPKAAGTSLKTSLANIEHVYTPPTQSNSNETLADMFVHDRTLNPIPAVTDFDEKIQANLLFGDDWNRLCVVRNPFNRLFSAWFSKVLLRQPHYIDKLPGYTLPDKFDAEEAIIQAFERFVDYLYSHGCNTDPHWDVQAQLLFHGTLTWHATCKFETLAQDLQQHKALFNNTDIGVDKLNVSGYNLNWRRVSTETISKIQSMYAADFSAFDYDKKPPRNGDQPNLLLTYVNAVIGRNKRIETLFHLRSQVDTIEAQLLDAQSLHAKRSRFIDEQLAQAKSQSASIKRLSIDNALFSEENRTLSTKNTHLREELDAISQKAQHLLKRSDDLSGHLHKANEQLSKTEGELSMIRRSRAWRLITWYRKYRASILSIFPFK